MTDPGGSRSPGSREHGDTPPPAPTLVDAIASLMNSGVEQARLLNMIVQNTGMQQGHREPDHGG